MPTRLNPGEDGKIWRRPRFLRSILYFFSQITGEFRRESFAADCTHRHHKAASRKSPQNKAFLHARICRCGPAGIYSLVICPGATKADTRSRPARRVAMSKPRAEVCRAQAQNALILITEGSVESALLGTLALTAVDGADKKRLLRVASREYATDCVLARPDAAALLAAAKRASPHADVTTIRADLLLRQVALMRSELATTPDFALASRMKWMEHSEIASDGLWLAGGMLLRAKVARVSR